MRVTNFKNAISREGLYAFEFSTLGFPDAMRCSGEGEVYFLFMEKRLWLNAGELFNDILKPTEEEIELAVMQHREITEHWFRNFTDHLHHPTVKLKVMATAILSLYGDPLL